MKISCDVVRDLLPLYIDCVCSDDSKRLIEEHLKECEACNEEYHLLTDHTYLNESDIDDVKIVEAASKVIKKEKRKSFIIGEIVLIFVVIIPLLFFGSTSFNPANIYFEAKGADYNKATIKVSYETPFFVCTYKEDENLDYNYNGQAITITCVNRIMPDKQYTVKEVIHGLYTLSDIPLCNLGERWMNAGISDSMVAIYRRVPSEKYPNVSGAFYVIVKTEEGYKSFIEKDVYSDLYSYEQPTLFKYRNKLKSGDVEIEDYKLINDLDSFINQIETEGFKLLVENYEDGLAFETCY